MRVNVRASAFETNSSSTHTLVMMMSDDYTRFVNGEIVYDRIDKKFVEKPQGNQWRYITFEEFVTDDDGTEIKSIDTPYGKVFAISVVRGDG